MPRCRNSPGTSTKERWRSSGASTVPLACLPSLTVLLALGIGWQTAVAYLIGAICSLGAGLMGMHIATRANVRTAQAATRGFNEAIGMLSIAGITVAVVGDTVGDPCKDTAAPAMNILLKLMTVVSLVFAPLIIAAHKVVVGLFF